MEHDTIQVEGGREVARTNLDYSFIENPLDKESKDPVRYSDTENTKELSSKSTQWAYLDDAQNEDACTPSKGRL